VELGVQENSPGDRQNSEDIVQNYEGEGFCVNDGMFSVEDDDENFISNIIIIFFEAFLTPPSQLVGSHDMTPIG